MIRPTPEKPIKLGQKPITRPGQDEIDAVDRDLRRAVLNLILRVAELEKRIDDWPQGADIQAELVAGRDLVYAIYHSKAEAVIAMPESVLRAYRRAFNVMRGGGT